MVQPAGTQFSINNLANARYVTSSWTWVQTPSDNLGTAGSNTIHLSPCPLGIDTSNNANAQYAVYIAGTGTAEAAPVTGGTCTPGGGSGTITVTTAYSHTAGYTAGSATSGIQEAINDSGTQRGAIYLLPGPIAHSARLGDSRGGCPDINLCLPDFFGPGFQILFYLRHKLVGYCAVNQAVVVAQREVDYGADGD